MFIQDAMAQTAEMAPNATPESTISTLVMMAIFLGIFYFLVYKPQANQAKKQKETMDSIKKNDIVVVASGIIGKVINVHSDEIVLVEISDGVVIRVEKDKIAEIIDKKHYIKIK